MPNCRTHTQVGAIAGVTLAGYHARDETPADLMMELLGGAIGGYVGGRLPDLIEPATFPGHRDVVHSCVALGAAASLALDGWRRECRTSATAYRETLASPTVLSDYQRAMCRLLDLLWRLAAGFSTGLQAGYISHLVLDGCTPSGLPVLRR